MNNTSDPNDLLTPSDAARVLGLSADSVRVLSDNGRLPAMRTVSGRRLFRRGDVDRLALQRAQNGASNGSRNGNGHANGNGNGTAQTEE
jgi:excisionase family DNA binding protein